MSVKSKQNSSVNFLLTAEFLTDAQRRNITQSPLQQCALNSD